jgi:hypothetical protein
LGIRETINKKPAHVAVIAGTAIIITFSLITCNFIPPSVDRSTIERGFFTTDEGATFFEAELSNIPPFTHEGREALRAHVYRCVSQKHDFVLYLEKYEPQTKLRLEKLAKEQPVFTIFAEGRAGKRLKKPGAPQNVWRDEDSFMRLLGMSCPEHGGPIEPVLPD